MEINRNLQNCIHDNYECIIKPINTYLELVLHIYIKKKKNVLPILYLVI